MSPRKIHGGEASLLAPASSPAAAGSSDMPLSGDAPRNAPGDSSVHVSASQSSLARLTDCCTKIGSGATPRGGKEAYRGGATALIRSQNVYNERFSYDGIVYIDDKQASELSNVTIAPKDVLLNITGDSVARCCQVPYDILPARVNQHVAVIRTKPEILDSKYLRYTLISHELQSHLLTLASAGATRNALTKGMIENLEIPLPPLPIQKAIAHILGTLDDRIELCLRMNETLEAMARALFKDWFIDFGPVRAKMEGREPPGLSPEIAALFPSKLVDSELGEIPENWQRVPFGELLKNSIGGDWGTDTPDEVNIIPVYIIRGTDFPTIKAGGIGKVPLRYTSMKKLSSRQLVEGDIIVEVSGGSPTQPTGRSLFITKEILERFPNAVECASFCRRFHPIDEIRGTIAYQHINHLYALGGTWEYQNQSTGIANFQTTRFLDSELVIWPNPEIARCFNDFMSDLLKKQAEFTISQLETLRDTLLPKLLSGDLSIPETMLQVEAEG